MENRRAVLCVVAFVGLALPFALLQRGQSGQPESFPRKPIADNAVPIEHLPFSEVQRVPGCASEEFWAKATLVACQPFQASDPHPRIVVTGGAGFVGGHVLRALRARGLTSVKVIDNFWRGRLSNLCPGCRCSLDLERDVCVRDLTSPTSAGDVFEGADIIYHLADVVAGIGFVFSNQEWLFRQNILINTNVLKAAVQSRTVQKYIYVGTACSFPLELQSSYDVIALHEAQTYPAHPESAYGWSKLMGEYEAELVSAGQRGAQKKLAIGLLRFHNLYGDGAEYMDKLSSQALPALIRKAIHNPKLENFELWGSGKQYRDFLYISDAVAGLFAMEDTGMDQGVIQIGTGMPTTLLQAASIVQQLTRECLGKNLTLVTNQNMREGDRGRVAYLDRAKRIMHWQPQVPIQQGLALSYHWILNDMSQRGHLEQWMLKGHVSAALQCLQDKAREGSTKSFCEGCAEARVPNGMPVWQLPQTSTGSPLQAAPVATTSPSKVTTPVMQPRYAIASYMVGNATSQVIAALVLRMQLVISRTIDNASTMATPVTVLLHDGGVLPGALNILRASGWETRLISPPIRVPETLYKSLALHAKTRQVSDKAIWFQKLAIFTQMTDFDRVLYMDLDLLPLVSLKDVWEFNLTGAALGAVSEKPGLSPEFQAGFLLFEPSQVDGQDLMNHLEDPNQTCGYRADDQSFLCHYFHRRWRELPRQLDVEWKFQSESFYGPSATWRVIHFNGNKPWQAKMPKNDRWAKLWHEVRRQCGACDSVQNLVWTSTLPPALAETSSGSQIVSQTSAATVAPGNGTEATAKATVVYLVTRAAYLRQLGTSLKLLKENWFSKFPMPVIVFHTSDIQAGEIQHVAESAGAKTETVLISPTLPDYFNELQARRACLCCCNNHPGPGRRGPGGMIVGQYHVNYCAMNRFRTLEMYRHPALANFDYFVQMDTDLYVKKPMPYNPVQRMAESKAVFGYHEKVVHPSVQQDCNLGLYDAISGWINRSELAPKYVPALGTNYAGNFNIGDLGFFRSEQYYAFARWIHNEETGIWTRRWGDQAYLPNILGVYFPEDKHVHFRDLFEDKVLVHKSESVGRAVR